MTKERDGPCPSGLGRIARRPANAPNYTGTVQRLQAQLRPTQHQQWQMRCFAGCARFVYNKALALQQERRARGETHLSYAALWKRLTDWRHSPDTLWLREAPIHPSQQALKNLDRACRNFFQDLAKVQCGEILPEAVREPRFHRKGRNDSFRHPDPKQFQVDSANGRLFLPKLGWLRYRGGILLAVPARNTSRTCPKCGSVSAENRKSQACFLCIECGFEESADLVGAINILRAGHAQLACQASGAVMPPATGTHRRAAVCAAR